MSQPPSGDYRIVSLRPDPTGRQLALTYNGNNVVVNVAVRNDNPGEGDKQLWTIQQHAPDPRVQSISPKGHTDQQIAFGSAAGTLAVLPAHGYVWNIRGADNLYTIEDGGTTVFWGLNYFIIGENVSFGTKGTGLEEQQWTLVPV